MSWFPTSPCAPECLPVPAADAGLARVRRLVRTTWRLTALVGALLLGAALALLAPVLGPRRVGRVQALWSGWLLAAGGVRVVVTGPRPQPGSLVVANHVSWLDVLALNRVVPVRMLAKAEVRDWPLVGPMAARVGSVFLDRDRLRALPGAVAVVAGALREGACVGVFPEGTTRCGRDLGRFRPAAFQAALDAGAPVVPVALSYADAEGAPDAAAAFVGDDTLLASLIRVASARRTVLTVRVLPVQVPVPGAEGEARALPRRQAAGLAATTIGGALPEATADLRPWPAVHVDPVPARAGTVPPLVSVAVARDRGTVHTDEEVSRVA
ncbi:1-acyl-sn-glycerol-3-phosphate acyltransferase [Actinomycetospora endophytica]|uniref:1-acyl-sn-glycerol-3-phosphate acyltransferase n=1 Tax=Actinomycetospora endophytica TaxID=2291215 RepID=A0ABS8P6I5_9PSEU|nr:lysophospholipid acyltransferase family protein [Actinomycetospora endophytica]MCD2193853.1 1-acyl-sn-glycerol-3-phosphate acyltransferase [Actinomycetospora endophytica]